MVEDGSLSTDQTYLKKEKMELEENGERIGGGWSGGSDEWEAKTSRESGKSRVTYNAPSSGPWNLTAQPVSSFQRAELVSPRDRQDKVLEQDFSPAPCDTTAKLAPLLHFASDKDKQK